MIPLLVDADPGVDDALALLMALNSAQHELVALTVTAGNVGLEHTLANSLRLMERFAPHVPVHGGSLGPLLHAAPWNAASIHGGDGFGDAGLPVATKSTEAEHAALAILRHSHAYAGKLVVVAMGPLTNLALALRLDPSLPSRVARLVVMGGAVRGPGNITPAAEFNVAFDPEAAHVVLGSFPSVELVDWSATLEHGLPHAQFDAWLARGGERASFYAAISLVTRQWSADSVGHVWYSADALAMALALEPAGALELRSCSLAVQLGFGPARGLTVADWTGSGASVLVSYDLERFLGMVERALS